MTSLFLLAALAFGGDTKPPAPTSVPIAPPVPVDPLATMPAIGAPPPFAPPTPVVSQLSNGIPVWFVEDHGLPIVSFSISVAGGSATDPDKKSGRATLSDQMMRQGAGSLDATAFAELVEREAIQLDVSTSRTASTITVTCHHDKLDRALDLVADMILRPTFGAADLKRERTLETAMLLQDENDPVPTATRLAWTQWWGDGHPYANPIDGTAAELKKLKTKDIAAYHADAWNAKGARIVIAGDVKAADLADTLERRFATWTSTESFTTDIAAPVDHHAEILAVDRPGSAQTMFYVVFKGLPFAAVQAPELRAGSIVLGGTFTSRLNALLREKRGFTYGVRASSIEQRGGGVAVISTRIRTDATGDAFTDLVSELQLAQSGITPEELGKAKGAWRTDVVESMGSREGVVGAFLPYTMADLGPEALGAALVSMDGVTKERVDAALRTYDPKGGCLYVLVGDRKTIEPLLENAGAGPITWVNP